MRIPPTRPGCAGRWAIDTSPLGDHSPLRSGVWCERKVDDVERTRSTAMKRVVGFLATLYRELRDSRKIFRPEWDWWRWGIGLWLDADLDPGFDWTHLLFFMHLGPFRLTMGLEDND